MDPKRLEAARLYVQIGKELAERTTEPGQPVEYSMACLLMDDLLRALESERARCAAICHELEEEARQAAETIEKGE